MAVTTEDVQEGFRVLFAASGALTGLVADPPLEGLTADPAANAVAAPYTEFKVVAGAVTRTAPGAYLQEFDVTVKTYSEAPDAALGPYQQALEAALTVRTNTAVALPSGRTLALLYCLKKPPGGIEEDEDTQKAQAVKYSTDRYVALCQG